MDTQSGPLLPLLRRSARLRQRGHQSAVVVVVDTKPLPNGSVKKKDEEFKSPKNKIERRTGCEKTEVAFDNKRASKKVVIRDEEVGTRRRKRSETTTATKKAEVIATAVDHVLPDKSKDNSASAGPEQGDDGSLSCTPTETKGNSSNKKRDLSSDESAATTTSIKRPVSASTLNVPSSSTFTTEPTAFLTKKTRRISKKNDMTPTTTITTPTDKKAKSHRVEHEEDKVIVNSLPRTRELQLRDLHSSSSNTSPSLTNYHHHQQSPPFYVIGVDEAGRGPLAGPVVAAAAYIPPLEQQQQQHILGIRDSKKIVNEHEREELYERIVSLEAVHWAASIIDASRIDEINILQATLEGMRKATAAVIRSINGGNGTTTTKNKKSKEEKEEEELVFASASADRIGSYVVCGRYNSSNVVANDRERDSSTVDKTNATKAIVNKECMRADDDTTMKKDDDDADTKFYALVDGNRLPKDMPCEAETMIGGDGREFCIAVASIIAKVTRDRLMHAYDGMYPQYELGRHKGYPTAAHMAAVREHGASPIHRRTFAPLKHMMFDVEGRIVVSK